MKYRESVNSPSKSLSVSYRVSKLSRLSELLVTRWAVRGGLSFLQALYVNYGNSGQDAKREYQGGSTAKILSIDAWTEDGPTRSSDEAPVMGVEQRGRVLDRGVTTYNWPKGQDDTK